MSEHKSISFEHSPHAGACPVDSMIYCPACRSGVSIYDYDRFSSADFTSQFKKQNITEDIQILIDYPLKQYFVFTCKAPATNHEIAFQILTWYKRIYSAERTTSRLEEETISDRTNGLHKLMNRATTDGLFGIWGHVLEDLELHGIEKVGEFWRISTSS